MKCQQQMHRCLTAAGMPADASDPSGREIVTVKSLKKVMKAVQGHRRSLTFICHTQAALALPPFAFPSPDCIPYSSPALFGNAVSQGFFYLIQNKCKCVT